jgi:threonine dehydrogenase-like Zn-dependent dehydrogenase
MVLEAFGEPLVERTYEVADLAPGEVLCRVTAAGVCGSDVHMWQGRDPRTPLPLILGHEGVGTIAELAGAKRDLLGRALQPGDPVVWERGLMCGQCYFCVVRKQPALCPHRRTYGISVGCSEPPHFSGCYAEVIHLRAGCHLLRLDDDTDPALLAAASCSGASATHAVELAHIERGCNVLVIGPGPLGLFCLALAIDSGAGAVYLAGRTSSQTRLDLGRQLGATDVLVLDRMTPEQRREQVLDWTHGWGFDAILDCTGSPATIPEHLPEVAAYGTYALPGIATPVGEVGIEVFEHLARRNVNLQGAWVSDTRHLFQAIRLVQSGRYPLHKLVTHRLPLSQATEALHAMQGRQAIKAVLTIEH